MQCYELYCIVVQSYGICISAIIKMYSITGFETLIHSSCKQTQFVLAFL